MSTKPEEDDPLAFVKKRNKSYTLFDNVPADTVNLKMGAPGEALLKKSKEIMKKATVHKMVTTYLNVHVTSIVPPVCIHFNPYPGIASDRRGGGGFTCISIL